MPERGIYFDGWLQNNHCYHPSLPMRNIRMIDDIEEYRGTMLVWSALGGGSISLPWLEHEAFGDVDPRLRFYGFMNDSEFIKECGKRGIKVFGIVFEVQGWEFPIILAEEDEEKPKLKAVNVLRGGESKDWYGLREFGADRHWRLFGKKLRDYFPQGLTNSAGEAVSDLWEECCARTYKGIPVHSDWVEVKNHKHIAYQMCRNNPVWREYLKKIMEIQIDAGVQGIQLDECELPMTSIGHGGCFCRDCVNGFRKYLLGLRDKGRLEDSILALDLEHFNYGSYLLESGRDFPVYYEDVPLYKHYWEYQLREVNKYFKELVDHAKAYSLLTRGESVLVSGNFFTLMPTYYPLWQYVDVIITEMKHTLFRQPSWYRFAAGFAQGKPVIVAENPYGGIIPELLEMLDRGEGYDLYRIFLLEAAVYGCNMSVPYGGWMGNTIQNAFHPPRHVTKEIQNFLADNERLFGPRSGADIAVLWSYPDNYWREAIAGYSGNVAFNANRDLLSYHSADSESPTSARHPFWELIKNLSDRQICYDVLTAPDGGLREDTFSYEDIEGYALVVLPDCPALTERQVQVFIRYASSENHKLLVFGQADSRLYDCPQTVRCENPEDKQEALASFANALDRLYRRAIRLSDPTPGIQTYVTPEGNRAVHIINYNYDRSGDAVKELDELKLTIPGMGIRPVAFHSPGFRAPSVETAEEDGQTVITLRRFPVYGVLEISSPE